MLLLAALALGTSMASCAAVGSPSAADDPERTRGTAPSEPVTPTVPGTPDPQIGEVPDALMLRILDAAAQRADVDVSAIEVRRAEAVTWPDGSLGCREPGEAYVQVPVDGYHVVLDAAGRELDYRASANGNFRYCENPGPNRPSDG